MHLVDLDYKIGAYPLFVKLNAHFPPGVTGILGNNGCGKSTLLRILSGLCEPDNGKVMIDNQDLYANARRLKPRIGYVPASAHLYAHLTITENFYFAAKINGLDSSTFAHNIKIIFQQCHLMGFEKVLFAKCSDGIKKRAMIALSLIHQPKILILDEPCAKLDPTMRRQLWLLLASLAKEGRQILFSSHHPHEISPWCDQIYHLQQGRLHQPPHPLETNQTSPRSTACEETV